MAGIAGLGVYVPPEVVSADQLAAESGVPAEIVREKFGIVQVHRAGPQVHVSDMGAAAVEAALDDAGVAPEDVDLLVYCGSEYKDYAVWSAAARIAQLTGCRRAETFELYALCAGVPIALRVVRDMMAAEGDVAIALVVAASKERELVDRSRRDTRFMLDFGDGAAAAVVRRDGQGNRILGSAGVTDSAMSLDVIRPGSGSGEGGDGYLQVPDLDGMRARLAETSASNFQRVIASALERSGRSRVDLLAPVHMKRSMYRWLCDTTGAERGVYLERYGHIQAADPLVALAEARREGLVRPGDTVVLVAAGVGYTWAATVVEWGMGGEGDG